MPDSQSNAGKFSSLGRAVTASAINRLGIAGFCGYHWRAYRSHIVEQRSVEGMVLTSLRGSTFIAILFSVVFS